jgi:hypothetical protein
MSFESLPEIYHFRFEKEQEENRLHVIISQEIERDDNL